MKTTVSVKKIGCANFKAMIESDKLILNDGDTVTELYTFSRDKDTYRAEEGNHDDLAMTMVMFSWLAAQSFFKKQKLDRRDSILPRASDSVYNTEMKFTGDDDLAMLSKAHDQIEF